MARIHRTKTIHEAFAINGHAMGTDRRAVHPEGDSMDNLELHRCVSTCSPEASSNASLAMLR